MPSAEYAKRLLQGLKYGYISIDKGDRTGQAEMYLHCSDRGAGRLMIGPGLGLFI